MIDLTDRRYHILKDISIKYKYLRLKLFDDEIRAEKSLIKSQEERYENNELKSGESGLLYAMPLLVPCMTLDRSHSILLLLIFFLSLCREFYVLKMKVTKCTT